MWTWRRWRRQVTCREMVGLMTDYLEGALSERDRRRFEEHLPGCANCSEYLEQIRAIVRAAGRPDPNDPPTPSQAELHRLFQALRSD
jgi:anti-sigma factor RsiW